MEKFNNAEFLLKELISNKVSVEEIKLKFLSKNGIINELYSILKELDDTDKKLFGLKINTLRSEAETYVKNNLGSKEFEVSINDKSIPSIVKNSGSKHPLTIVKDEICDIFNKFGFSFSDGPEMEDDWHNFSALNFPPDHPARDMQDTFFIDSIYALRTHTSSVQVRLMENYTLPLRYIMPGRVYRNEAVSARANCFFHQIEGLYIDKKVSFTDLKYILFQFVKEYYGDEIKIRFRPSYFPFTEPSAEMDISCLICHGIGCNICKHTGWVEILGCGMVDPQVLKNSNINPEIFNGYAFGMGVERIAMLKYRVNDLRIFFDNDLRFYDFL